MTRNFSPFAIVFDLDGTLIDSLPDVVGALNKLLGEEDRRPITVAEGRRMVGEGAAAMVERAFAVTGAEAIGETLATLTERYIAHYRVTPVKDTIVYPGVLDVLTRFKTQGVAMGICTNKPHEMSRVVLERLGMNLYFGSIIGGDALPVKKPDARHVFAVLDELGTERTGAYFVGDSGTDMAAARNAGLPAILVSYGYSKVPASELEADFLIDDFDQLPHALDTLASRRTEPTI